MSSGIREGLQGSAGAPGQLCASGQDQGLLCRGPQSCCSSGGCPCASTGLLYLFGNLTYSQVTVCFIRFLDPQLGGKGRSQNNDLPGFVFEIFPVVCPEPDLILGISAIAVDLATSSRWALVNVTPCSQRSLVCLLLASG